jgi:hypothetical protein
MQQNANMHIIEDQEPATISIVEPNSILVINQQ